MSIATLLNEQLTLEHRANTGTDRYNNQVATTTSSEEIVGLIEQTAATEVLTDRETYTSTWRAFLPAETQVDASDRLTRADETTFEIIGPPASIYNPRLRKVSHIECTLRVTTG